MKSDVEIPCAASKPVNPATSPVSLSARSGACWAAAWLWVEARGAAFGAGFFFARAGLFLPGRAGGAAGWSSA